MNENQELTDEEKFLAQLEEFITNHYTEIACFSYEGLLAVGRGVVWLRVRDMTHENSAPNSGVLPIFYVRADDEAIQKYFSERSLRDINEYDLDDQGIFYIEDINGVHVVPIGLARFPPPRQVYLENLEIDQTPN